MPETILRERRRCPHCGRPDVAVKKDGTLWQHTTWPPRKWGRLNPICPQRPFRGGRDA